MSDAQTDQNTLLDLEEAEKTARQIAIEASGAQKLLNDAVFTGFLEYMYREAANTAVFAENPAIREENRVKAKVIAELRGALEVAARLPTDLQEQAERAKSFE